MAIKCGSCRGSHDKAVEVRECYGYSTVGMLEDSYWDTNPDPMKQQVERQTAGIFDDDAPVKVEDGFYTVVFHDNDYRTLRVRTQDTKARFAPGEQVVSFLSGQDNESDYTGFAFLKPDGRFNVWKRFRDNDRLDRALRILTTHAEEAGQEYALRSGRCRRCNRTLTVPASINRGYGPVCDGMVA